MTICMQCTTEENEVSFPTVKEFIEHKKSGHTIMPKVETAKPIEVAESVNTPPQTPAQLKKEPIILVYKFLGNCDICNNPVDTIKVELGEKDMMIAYCAADKKQWTSQKVIPIIQQGIINEVKKKR